MFESGKWSVIGMAIFVMAVAGLLARNLLDCATVRLAVSARSSSIDPGEYGGDLDFLRRSWTPPQGPGESNHYIDLWSPGSLPVLARINGLTNNQALFVDSHGKAGCSVRGSGYGFYPRETLLRPNEKAPCFSAGDLAAVLGPETAGKIHNIVLAGCNEEGRFRSGELRRYFINATNITYMRPGELAFKPMFYQAIVLPSSEIKPLYGKPRRISANRVECDVLDEPLRGTKPLGAYIADLYLPGARKPYRTQRAGRELLQPQPPATPILRAEASPEMVEP